MQCTKFKVSFHRNGVGGWGFWAVTFDWKDDDGQDHRMVATVPSASDSLKIKRHDCVICVLDIDLLAKGDVLFGSNSWRGDHFHGAVWKAIDDYCASKGL